MSIPPTTSSVKAKQAYCEPHLHVYGTMAELTKEASISSLDDIKGILASCMIRGRGRGRGPAVCTSW